MKKLLILFTVTAAFLSAADKKIPERPANVPEDAEWDAKSWKYNDKLYTRPFIGWHKNGNLSWVFYETDNKKYLIREYYYENGKLRQKLQKIRFAYLKENHKKAEVHSGNYYVGKQLLYHENGRVKEERCYTFILKKNQTRENVMCGPEIFYDESGKEVKRVEHNAKCEYGCDEVPRLSVDQLIPQIKAYREKTRIRGLVKRPVVGKILSVDASSGGIEIAYKKGFTLSPGDLACCLIDNEVVSFECIKNEAGKGRFVLKEDKKNKFSLVSKKTEPRFYKKNEIKYSDLLKSKSKPGEIKVIGGIEFVYIPAGKYFQWPDDGYREDVKGFWMTKYEVTLGEFLKYCYENDAGLPWNKKDVTLNSTYPVNLGIHADDAEKFCAWFANKHGVKTMLPTDKEWEYAAQGGSMNQYYWGNGNMDDYCWHFKNSGGRIHPVGRKKPNGYGLYDMIGNAWEWCENYHLKGGSWNSGEKDLQYGSDQNVSPLDFERYEDNPDFMDIFKEGIGFRMIIREKE